MALDKRDVRSLDAAAFLNTEANSAAILADTAAIKIATEATQAALETVGGLVVNLGANNDVTVTGTVDLGAVDNAVLDAIEADTTTLAGAVSGTEMQVDVITLPNVAQTTHDNLNANANIQVGNTDVSGVNPVPVSIVSGEPVGVTPKAAQSTTASLAAQASETEEFVLGSDVTASLQSVTVAADVAFKAVIQKVDETPTITTIATLYGEPGATVQWVPRNPTAALHQVASDGTPTAKYQVVITNNGISAVGGSGAISVHLEHDEVAN